MTEMNYFKETGPVDTSLINNNEYQPRSKISSEKLEELKESIKLSGGNIEYVTLMEKGTELITLAGHRRVQACNELGLFVNARIIEEKSDQDAWTIAISTNIKEDMSIIDLIRSVKKLSEFEGSSTREISKKLGLSHGATERYFSCTKLVQPILEKIDSTDLAISKAVLIASIPQKQQLFFAEQVIANGWTTELTKKYVEMWNFSKIGLKNSLKKGKITWEAAYNNYLDTKAIEKLIEFGFPEDAPDHHKLLYARSLEMWDHNDAVYRIKMYNDYIQYNQDLITLLSDNATTWENIENSYRIQMAEEKHLEEFGPKISDFKEKWNLEDEFDILVFADRQEQIDEIATTLEDQFEFIPKDWINQFRQDEDLGKLLSGIDNFLEEIKEIAEKQINEDTMPLEDILQDTSEAVSLCNNCKQQIHFTMLGTHECEVVTTTKTSSEENHGKFLEELEKESQENIDSNNRRQLYTDLFTKSVDYINSHLDKKIKNNTISEIEENLFLSLKGSMNRWEALQKQGQQYQTADIDALQRIYDMQKAAFDEFKISIDNDKIAKHKAVFLPLLQTIDEKYNLDIVEQVEFVSGCNLMRTNIKSALDCKLAITNQKSLLQTFRETGDLQPFYDAVCKGKDIDPPFDFKGLHDVCTIGYKHDASECVLDTRKVAAYGEKTSEKDEKIDKLDIYLDEDAQKASLNVTNAESNSDTKDELKLDANQRVNKLEEQKEIINGLTKLDELHYIDFSLIKKQVKQLHGILAIKYDLTRHLELVENSTDLLLEETKNILEYKKRGVGLLKQPPNERRHEIMKCNLVSLLNNEFVKKYNLEHMLPEEIQSRARNQVIQFSLILLPNVKDQRVIIVPWISFGPSSSKHYWGGGEFITDTYPDFFEVFKIQEK